MTGRKRTENTGWRFFPGGGLRVLALCLLIGLAGIGHSAAYGQAKGESTDLKADNMLLCQRYNGGWSKSLNGKPVDYSKGYDPALVAEIKAQNGRKDATIDNGATTREIAYLLKAYHKTHRAAYLSAAEKGLDYLLAAQYDNGGWPQYYPDSSLYRSQVTFNDNAIINVMTLLRNVAGRKGVYAAVDKKYVPLSQKAVQKGIGCILKTQLITDGDKTGWNQQYNKTTLRPEKARTFELVGVATSESVGIVEFLMGIEHPSDEVKAAVNGAIAWFDQVAIHDYVAKKVDAPGEVRGKDLVLVKSPGATLWARFYEIGTNRPFFCGRDGVRKYDLREIENERRAGYAWYGTWPLTLKEEYNHWLKKNRHG